MTIRQHKQIEVDDHLDVTDVAVESGPDLSAYVVAIWRRLPWILGAALVCGAIAAYLTASKPIQYEAVSTLAVTGSKIGEQSPSVAAVNFRPLIENNSVAALVVKEFSLGDAPYFLTPERFLSSPLFVEEVRNSNLIRVRVTLIDPALAAKVANRVSDLAVEGARKLSQAEAVQARDDLRIEVDDARKQMEAAATRLASFQTTAQVELTREDVKSMLEQRGRILPLGVDIEAARARVARGEAELASRQRVQSLTKAIDSDPTLAQAARAAGAPEGSLLRLQVKSEEVNKVYEVIEQDLAADRAILASLEGRRAELIDVRGLNAEQQSRLTALYRKETELARLTTEHEVAEKSYKEIAARYDVARVQIAGRSGQIQIIDRAIVSSVPKSRRILRYTVFAVVAGGVLSTGALLLAWAIGDMLKRARAA